MIETETYKDIISKFKKDDEEKKNLIYVVLILIFIIPLMFANVWFIQQIWNEGLCKIFIMIPYLSYKATFILYFIKCMFGLNYQPPAGYYIENMINKKYSNIKNSCLEMFSYTILYFLTWLIVVKIIL